MFDPNHPFYRPLWRRVLIVVVSAGWALVEYRNGENIWAMLFAAIGAWCAWFFFVVYDNEKSKDDGQDQQPDTKNEGD